MHSDCLPTCRPPLPRSPHLHRVSYQVLARPLLDEALPAFMALGELRQLELIVKNFTLSADNLRHIGGRGQQEQAGVQPLSPVLGGLRQAELDVLNTRSAAVAGSAAAGMLPLTELRLDSLIYKQQPTLSRAAYSHVDNEGVKALVDSICNRW